MDGWVDRLQLWLAEHSNPPAFGGSKWGGSLLPSITSGWKQSRKGTNNMGWWGHLSGERTRVPREGAPGRDTAASPPLGG